MSSASFEEKFRRGLCAARAAAKRIFTAVFGDVSWQPPGWLSSSTAATRRGRAILATAVRERPRQSALIAASALVVIIGGLFAWRWYEARPKPVAIAVTVVPPSITCYACEPPGEPHPLVVQFESSVAPLDRVGHPLDAKSGVKLEPELAGQWTWSDDKQLSFQPKADWPIGARFTVELSRKGFVAEHVRLQDYELEFDTPAFDARVAATEFHQDPVVAGNKKVVATISFTHAVDPESFDVMKFDGRSM